MSVTVSRNETSEPVYSPADAVELVRLQFRREDGQSMTEYGVLLALIAVVVIVALLFLGPKIAAVFSAIGSKL